MIPWGDILHQEGRGQCEKLHPFSQNGQKSAKNNDVINIKIAVERKNRYQRDYSISSAGTIFDFPNCTVKLSLSPSLKNNLILLLGRILRPVSQPTARVS